MDVPIDDGTKFLRLEGFDRICEDVADLQLTVVALLEVGHVSQRVLVNFGAAGKQNSLELFDNENKSHIFLGIQY